MLSIKNLPQYDFPKSAHNKIMKKIYFLNFLKFRLPFLFLIILSAANLVSSSWHLFTKASEMETFNIFKAMLGQFEFNLDYLSGLLAVMIENAPLNLVLPFLINLIFIAYLIYIIKIFTKVEKNLNY